MTMPTTRDKHSEERSLERERRHINREDDPHFDPTDKTAGDKIPGADQTPNHEVKRTGRVRARMPPEGTANASLSACPEKPLH